MQGFASIVMSPAVQMNRAISPQHGSASSDLLEAVFPPPAPAAARRRLSPAGVGSCSDCIPAFNSVQNVAASCPDGCRALPREIVPVTHLKPAASKGLHQASHTQQTRTQLSSQRSSALAPSPWSLQEQNFSEQPCQGSLQSCTSTTGTPTYFLLRFRINGTGER